MNLPNKLTIARVIMIPFFVFFLLINPESTALRIIADIIFIAASLTDMADGKIANQTDEKCREIGNGGNPEPCAADDAEFTCFLLHHPRTCIG